ncbi:MAG: oligosaccharide flippase family protein [Flexistipes sinusarabici]|uniref:Oligosaccharide flippase family protein n=1 Tax=Flexistipes sinusarabici TaxID=2352 RepID=A0A5D0MR08_FLESI|nr:oligosaccharide flippase family protein [Flexistipes sinusarabici]TYB33259.1 MAG: oligosaccharide flippase family protein [Flexistipes sinusarabici]
MFKNVHIREIFSGSVFTIGYQTTGMLFGYIFVFIVSNKIGAGAVGIYQIAMQSITLASIIALFGTNQAIIRYTSQLRVEKKESILKYIIRNNYFIIIITTICLSLMFILLNKFFAATFLKNNTLGNVFIIAGICVPFFALNLFGVEIIRGLKVIKLSEFLRNLSLRIISLITILVLLIFSLNKYSPVVALAFGIIITSLMTLFFVFKLFLSKVSYKKDYIEFKKYFKTSKTMYQSILLMQISTIMPIFILAYFSNPSEVGIYNVANRLAMLAGIIFTGVTTIVAPKFSELFWSKKQEELQKVVTMTSKILFWTCGVLSILLMIFSVPLLSLFGSEFTKGYVYLIILAFSNFFNAFTGPSGWLLDMIGASNFRRNILTFSTIFTVLLMFSLIPLYGGLGLAVTILLNCVLSNSIGIFFIYKKYGINMVYLPLIFSER